MVAPLRIAGRFVLDLVYPARCAGCLRRGYWVCDRCWSRFPAETDQPCARCGVRWCVCGTGAGSVVRVYAFAPYDDWLRQAIISYKYHAERARHEHLGELLVPIVRALGTADTLVPVPLHRRREHVRGYNQSRLLASTVGASLGLPVVDALARSVDTRQQVSLAAELRRTNVIGAFEIRRDVADLNIVLIDDVITTGATVGECASELLRAGAASVRAVTLAHG